MENVQVIDNTSINENLKHNKKILSKEEKIEKTKNIGSKIFLYTMLTIFAVIAVFPFIVMIFISLMKEDQYTYIATILDFLPKTFEISNYVNAFNYSDYSGFNFLVAITNTIIVASISTVLGLIITILASYAFAKMNFKGKNILFFILLATIMIPAEMFTLGNFTMTVAKLDLKNTLTALILPFLVSTYYIFLLRNTFMQIPNELYKAAKVDGLSDFKYLIKVMVPLAMPTIISIAILKVIATWNSFIWPALVNDEKYLLVSNWMNAAGLPADPGLENLVYQTIKMAASTIITIPLVILFVVFRKKIMSGISRSGIKG